MKNSSFLVVFEQIAKASAFEKYRILNKFTNFQMVRRSTANPFRGSGCLRFARLTRISTSRLLTRELGSGWTMEGSNGKRGETSTTREGLLGSDEAEQTERVETGENCGKRKRSRVSFPGMKPSTKARKGPNT